MWTQNLMESENHFKTMFGWMRGKFKGIKWEYCWRKSPIDPIFKCVADIGGGNRNDGEVLFIFGLLGFSIYLTIKNLVPKKYRHIWAYFDQNGKSIPGNGMGRSYGIRWDGHSFSGDWHKSIGESSTRKPNPYGWGFYWWNFWNWEYAGTQYMEEGSMEWRNELPWGERDKENRATWILPYHYMLENGEVQHRKATVTVNRMQWGIRFLVRRLGLKKIGPMKRIQSIDVKFDGEVGERSGSWKGGCIGCSYEMKRGETPQMTLRRMQRERRFN